LDDSTPNLDPHRSVVGTFLPFADVRVRSANVEKPVAIARNEPLSFMIPSEAAVGGVLRGISPGRRTETGSGQKQVSGN